jgi:hypothetical protein
MSISLATRDAVRQASNHAGDASGSADRARWAVDHGDLEMAEEALSWAVDQAEKALRHARKAWDAVKLEGGAT